MENEDHMTLSVVICYYAQALIGGGIKRRCCLTSVCLSVSYIGPKTRTERPLRPKLAQRLATSHVTGTTLSRSRSPGRFAHRRVGASGGCSGWRGNGFDREKLLLRCRLFGGARCFDAHGGLGVGAHCGGRPPTAC